MWRFSGDALETNDSAVAGLGDATLRTIARELTATVRQNVSIDWSQRESARAHLRRLVKRLLLVQHREIQDTDLGGHFTLKRYHSEKSPALDSDWKHTKIVLSPDTTAEGYEPIVLEASGDEEVQVIAEWLGAVG